MALTVRQLINYFCNHYFGLHRRKLILLWIHPLPLQTNTTILKLTFEAYKLASN